MIATRATADSITKVNLFITQCKIHFYACKVINAYSMVQFFSLKGRIFTMKLLFGG